MKIDILTLFPEMFSGFKDESIIKRAIDEKKVKINTHNFRDYAKNKHKKVDDTPFGGGDGMVLMCQPIFDAVNDIKKKDSKVILLSPQGKKYDQKKAYELSKEKHIIFICGHYEGFDERIKTICDEEISIGDYVLTGGELPAMVITDSIVRLLPGVIEEGSHLNDSFNNGLLDYPAYTKPRSYKGLDVPEVLLSGDHKLIEEWRKEKQIEITKEKRPDLLRGKVKLEKKGIKENKNKIYIDDIKNIKVTPIINKKDGKYILFNSDKVIAITIFNPKKVKGFKLKGKSNERNSKRIIIVKHEFINKVVNKNINKRLSMLTYRLNIALADEEDEESTARVLDEAEMLKQMIISMYSRYLGADKINAIISTINVLINEFMRAKTLQRSLIEKDTYKTR